MRARSAFAVVALLLLAGCTGSLPSASTADSGGTGGAPDFGAGRVTAHVEHVVDGDTIDVSYANGTEDTVRMVGIDTPETHAKNTPDEYQGVPNTTAGKSCLHRWGENASAFAHRKLANRDVTLVFDPNTDRRGYYGRLLAYVYVGNDSYDYDAVAGGFARVYEDSTFSQKSRYERAAQRARDSNEALWTCRTPATDGGSGSGATTAPSSGESGASASNASLELRVHADASGADGSNLNDEYVTVTNAGSAALAMGNWTLTDAAGHTYTFPSGFSLPANATVTVHTGRGTDTSTALYWGASRPIWNNDGDTATVRTQNGTRVATSSY